MTTNIDTLKMTRTIRDKHYELLKNKTPEERLAFYQGKARELHQKLGLTAEEHPTAPLARRT